jgi:hypothetical protein
MVGEWKRRGAAAGTVAALVIVLLDDHAWAQSLEGRGRLGLEGNLFRHESITAESENEVELPSGETARLTSTASSTGFGLATGGGGLGFSLGVSDENRSRLVVQRRNR